MTNPTLRSALALLATLVILGCNSSSPTNPGSSSGGRTVSDAGTLAQKPPFKPGKGNDATDTYRVLVYIGGEEEDDLVADFPGVSAGPERLQQADGRFNMDLRDVGIPDACTEPSLEFMGLFDLNQLGDEDPFLAISYYAIRLGDGNGGDAVDYNLVFGARVPGEWLDPACGLPTTGDLCESNTVTGNGLKTGLKKKKNDCRATFYDLPWSIVVTLNTPS